MFTVEMWFTKPMPSVIFNIMIHVWNEASTRWWINVPLFSYYFLPSLSTAKGVLPSHPTVPIVPQRTPALMVNAHTHPDMMYPMVGGADPQLSFFHPSQMSKPPPARMPLSHPAYTTRPPPPLPAQNPQIRKPGIPPFTTMTVPPPMAFPSPSASLRSKTPSSLSSSSISSSSTTPSQKKQMPASTHFQNAQSTRSKIQNSAPVSPIFICRSIAFINLLLSPPDLFVNLYLLKSSRIFHHQIKYP